MTAYRALARIADLIGWDGCATVAGKSEWTMRKYADPDTEREISLQDAMRLDLAFGRAGGRGSPLFECYAARLYAEVDANPDDFGDLLHAVRDAARESGEAVDAALMTAASGRERHTALREVAEAVAAWVTILTRIERMAAHGR
jgi:hypothetical protein